MTSAEIRSQFPPWAPVIIGDATVARPTLVWLRDRFWPWFRKQRFALGLHKWTRRLQTLFLSSLTAPTGVSAKPDALTKPHPW